MPIPQSVIEFVGGEDKMLQLFEDVGRSKMIMLRALHATHARCPGPVTEGGLERITFAANMAIDAEEYADLVLGDR